MSGMSLVQVGVTLFLLVPLFFLGKAILYGWAIADSDPDDHQDACLERHKSATSELLCTTVIMIVVVELAVQWARGQGKVPALLWVFVPHLGCAVAFLGLILVLKLGSGLYMLWSW